MGYLVTEKFYLKLRPFSPSEPIVFEENMMQDFQEPSVPVEVTLALAMDRTKKYNHKGPRNKSLLISFVPRWSFKFDEG